MGANELIGDLSAQTQEHLGNIAKNLQLVADMGYGDVALALARADGMLEVVADARPHTAVAPVASSRVGQTLDPAEETEAYQALSSALPVCGSIRRVARGIKYSTSAYPIESADVKAVLVKNLAEQVAAAPGTMETAFMDAAEELIGAVREAPLLDARDGTPFSTTRRAGDGVMRVSTVGRVVYASPNAVNIMRLAGVEGALVGTKASALPGGGFGIAPVMGTSGAIAVETEVANRVLGYRTISLPTGPLVLVEDLTDARRREAEIKIKEATIREVHHRVKNNLQTIASLLRIQARRTASEEARNALAEATERVSSMAVVHDMLAVSDEERVDFAEAARTVVELVSKGLLGDDSSIEVTVKGTTGQVDATVATALALTVAELVHNAIEHAFVARGEGHIQVAMRRVPGELVLTVHDDGCGLPEGFDLANAANLGLEIVRTVVEKDLRGTLSFASARGTKVTVRVPLKD